MQRLLVSLIDFYRIFLSFDRGILKLFAPSGACRFEVSCSEYLKRAIIREGTGKGLWLGFKRLLRCNPYV